jgi:hypothetical protein
MSKLQTLTYTCLGGGIDLSHFSFSPQTKDEEILKRHILSLDPQAKDIRFDYLDGTVFIIYYTCNTKRFLLKDMFQPWLTHARL